MTIKRVLCSERVRLIPAQFSWVDHRLVREHYIERCAPPAAALYLFLLTVADGEGLSYYSDSALVRALSMTAAGLSQARSELLRISLIAYQRPLYQVLSLDVPPGIAVRELSADEVGARLGQLRSALGRAR